MRVATIKSPDSRLLGKKQTRVTSYLLNKIITQYKRYSSIVSRDRLLAIEQSVLVAIYFKFLDLAEDRAGNKGLGLGCGV